MIKIFIAIISLSLLYIANEYLHRKWKVKTYYTRKLVHVMSGIGAIVFSFILDKNEFLLSTAFFVVLFSFLFKLKVLRSVRTEGTIGEILYPIQSHYLTDKVYLFPEY